METFISHSDAEPSTQSSTKSPYAIASARRRQSPTVPSVVDRQQFKGVRRRTWGKWVCEIRMPKSRERIWLGSYSTPDEAAMAYDAAAIFLRGPSVPLNFPNLASQFAAAKQSISQLGNSSSMNISKQAIQALASAAAANYTKNCSSFANNSSNSNSCNSSVKDIDINIVSNSALDNENIDDAKLDDDNTISKSNNCAQDYDMASKTHFNNSIKTTVGNINHGDRVAMSSKFDQYLIKTDRVQTGHGESDVIHFNAANKVHGSAWSTVSSCINTGESMRSNSTDQINAYYNGGIINHVPKSSNNNTMQNSIDTQNPLHLPSLITCSSASNSSKHSYQSSVSLQIPPTTTTPTYTHDIITSSNSLSASKMPTTTAHFSEQLLNRHHHPQLNLNESS